MIINPNPDLQSPFMRQYAWEEDQAKLQSNHDNKFCNLCGKGMISGWCPNCHPLHYGELE